MTAVTTLQHLDSRLADAVRGLAEDAADTDGVSALSEASRLALDPGGPSGTAHLLAREDGALVGYAQVWPDRSAELVVSPAHRRQRVGTALWVGAAEAGAVRVWAHGDLPAARAFAEAGGLTPVRSLLRMGRPLSDADRDPRPLPEGYAVTTYADRAPEVEDPVRELQELNATAFAEHPEQGRLTVADLRARMEEPWFDPGGMLYVMDPTDPRRGPVAFHWTKIEDGDTPGAGEVYVVGVHPDHRGRGLAGPLTDLGLAHLAARGCREVVLYVDGDNTPARATYERAGLSVQSTDRVYALADSDDADG